MDFGGRGPATGSGSHDAGDGSRPSLWEVHFSQAFYVFYFERDWRQAGPALPQGRRNQSRARRWRRHITLYSSRTLGHGEDAVARANLARQMDPLSPFIHVLARVVFCGLARFDEAEQAARQGLELQPGYLFGLWFHGLALCGLGRGEEAVDALERAVAVSRAPIYVGFLGLAYARAGRPDDAIRLLHELEDRVTRGEYVPAFAFLEIYTGLNDLPSMRRMLAKSLEESAPALTLACTITQFRDSVRNDPEIQRLLRRILTRAYRAACGGLPVDDPRPQRNCDYAPAPICRKRVAKSK